MNELPLYDSLPFGGSTYDPALDGKRLTTQFQKVKAAMLSGRWFTLEELKEIAGGTDSSISARIRDLRKKPFGGYKVEAKRKGKGGTFQYRISYR